MKTEDQPALSKETQQMATYVAMVVRNAMEEFHVKHLTDNQMRELNPMIRNAIATALHAFDHYERSTAARSYVAFRSIPAYWEKPALLDGYVKMWERRSGD
jgi:hypothetical protein